MTDAARLLAANGLLQITFSTLLGWWLLHRLHVAGRRTGVRDLVAAHVDWVILGLVQVAVASCIERFGIRSALAPALLVVLGGWMNPIPYLARGLGVNAFVFAGSRTQRALAVLAGVSAVCLTAGLAWVTFAVLV